MFQYHEVTAQASTLLLYVMLFGLWIISTGLTNLKYTCWAYWVNYNHHYFRPSPTQPHNLYQRRPPCWIINCKPLNLQVTNQADKSCLNSAGKKTLTNKWINIGIQKIMKNVWKDNTHITLNTFQGLTVTFENECLKQCVICRDWLLQA